MFTLTWQYTPFMMLILLAGLQSQSGDILEAADVDGANALQTFRYMTLPHLRTYAELATLLGTVLDGPGLRPGQHHDQGRGRHQDAALPALRTGLHRPADR